MVGLVYFSPEGSSAYADEALFEVLENDYAKYSQMYPDYNFLICGDFNARTANDADFIVFDKLSFIPCDDDYSVDDDLPVRISIDKTRNHYGNCLLDLCKTSGLRIMNGRFLDASSQYTCISHTGGGSVIDYLLCNTATKKEIIDFSVGNRVESDHHPLIFSVKRKVRSNICTTESGCNVNVDPMIKLVWNDDFGGNFQEFWHSERADVLIRNTFVLLDNNDFNGTIAAINEMFYTAASDMKKEFKSGRVSNRKKVTNVWYDYGVRLMT